MAFEKLQITRYGTNPSGPKLPASMSISSHKTRPALKISLSLALTAEAGFADKASFDVMIGTEDDAGKLRIEASPTGRVIGHTVKRSGGLGFHLGYQPLVGTKPHKRVRTDARVIEAGCVEVDVIDFGSASVQTEPAPVKTPVASGGGARREKDAGDTINGITVDLTLDEENVTFKDKCVDVTTRQAKFVRLLAKPRPQTVAEAFLIGALWDGKPTKDAAEQLRLMAADLQKGLSGIGLDLRLVKGVGYQLRDL